MLRQIFISCCLLVLPFAAVAQDFDPLTVVCRTGPFTLGSPLTDGQTYNYQWERSFDGGTSWAATGTDTPELTISSPNAGVRYRMAYAPDAICLTDPACRTVTSATGLLLQIPAFSQGLAICGGDTVFVGGTALTAAGNHETILTTPGGCDSIVMTFLQILPAYNERFIVDLCPGENFRGLRITQDTLISATFPAASGCDSTLTWEVHPAFPTTPVITGPERLCAGEEARLTVPRNFSGIRWSTGSTGGGITVSSPGDYTVVLTDFTGCTLELSHTIEFTDLRIDAVTATPPACPGGTSGMLALSVSGDEDLLYSADGGETFQLDSAFTGLSAGDYDLVVENAAGCRATEAASLTEPDELGLTTNLPASQTIERGDSLPLVFTADFPVAEWRWNARPFLSCSDCPDPMAFPTVDTKFRVEAVAPGGCSVTDSVMVMVSDSRRYYAPTAFSPNGDDQNDVWRLFTGPRAETISGLQIADRWGGIRYRQPTDELPPEDVGWDGMDQGRRALPSGNYAWSASIRYSDGSSRLVRGQIMLMR